MILEVRACHVPRSSSWQITTNRAASDYAEALAIGWPPGHGASE
ncbi:hypothetical protein [Streptomyces sp. LN785]